MSQYNVMVFQRIYNTLYLILESLQRHVMIQLVYPEDISLDIMLIT